MKDTPLPLTVWATMNVGPPLVASAWSSALSTWAMSSDSTSSLPCLRAQKVGITMANISILKNGKWEPFDIRSGKFE